MARRVRITRLINEMKKRVELQYKRIGSNGG
jgi:hypothetical protein